MLSIAQARSEQEAGAAREVELDELVRLAAQEMLAMALEAERWAYLDRHAAIVDEG